MSDSVYKFVLAMGAAPAPGVNPYVQLIPIALVFAWASENGSSSPYRILRSTMGLLKKTSGFGMIDAAMSRRLLWMRRAGWSAAEGPRRLARHLLAME